jgi:hypothetical protein
MKRLCIGCRLGGNKELGRVLRHSGDAPSGDWHSKCFKEAEAVRRAEASQSITNERNMTRRPGLRAATQAQRLPEKWDELIDDFGERNERGPLCDAIRELIALNDKLTAENKSSGAGQRAVSQAQRVDALVRLVLEVHNNRPSRTAYQRVLRALKTLGLTPDEAGPVLYRLEYADRDGKPYPYLSEQSTKGKRG